MQDNELISIIIPTFKRSETLERAIKSALNQTYKKTEIIVVDDNANYPDIRRRNEEIVRKYNNVRLIKNKRNLGGGLSRNVGINESKGDIIAFLDDDDEYLPKKLEMQYELYRKSNNRVALVYCYAKMINVSGSTYIYKRDIEGCNLVENTINCIAATSWWLCSKKALLDVGGFEDIKSRQDASLIMKLMLRGYEVRRVPEVLLNYYWHDSKNGISKSNYESIEAEKQYYQLFLGRSHKIDKRLKEEVGYYFNYRIANLLARNNRVKEAWKYYAEMRRVHFFKKETIRVFVRLVFNKTFIKMSVLKNKKRVGC